MIKIRANFYLRVLCGTASYEYMGGSFLLQKLR
nr:MAG TPA: hypothetical protein [Caudoviricetes sp.]